MLRRTQWKCGVAALLAFGACSEGPSPTASVAVGRPLSATLANQPGQEVAWGIAQALANPTIRRSVLQAFRASPWVEHKLVLQQLITTTVGSELVAAAATALGVTAAEFTTQINALPLLDVYVPSRAERLSWNGDNTVGVALSTSMKVVPTSAYTSAGTTIPAASARAAGIVLVLLHPVEVKGRRMQRQAALAGSKIQDGDDGDIGVQFIQTLANGDTVVHDLRKNASGKWVIMQPDGSAGKELDIAVAERAAAAQRVASPFLNPVSLLICDEACSGGGGGGGSPPWTNVTSITTRAAPDGFAGIGSGCEFEFRATAFNPSTLTVVKTGTARITGVQCPEFYGQAYPGGIGFWSGSVPMIQTTIASGVHIDVDVVETDLISDDFYYPPPLITAASDKGRVYKGGDDVSYNPQLCAPGETCKQVHSTFNW